MIGSVPPGANGPSAAICGSRGELLPPEELQDWVGLGGPAVYKATGNEFLGYLVDLCGLQPGDAVLDVGCGSGRMALPLTGYLNRGGRYAGFDVSKEAIAWCVENISKSHPNFDFSVADVQSKRYNPMGKHKSSDFRFPYPDGSFDVVLLASVFTHMLPADVKHYMSEIVRVLKPGGRSLITFFLLNEESSALSKEGKGSITFEHEVQGARTANVDNPEAAIAYPEAFVRDLYKECGLELREPLRYGNWCGRPDGMSGQDVVIAVKAASRNRLAHGAHITDIQRPKGSTNHPLVALSDENIAVADPGAGGKRSLRGHVERVEKFLIAGWALCEDEPAERPEIQFVQGGEVVITLRPRFPRPQLRAALNLPASPAAPTYHWRLHMPFANGLRPDVPFSIVFRENGALLALGESRRLAAMQSVDLPDRANHLEDALDVSFVDEKPDLNRFGTSISFGENGHSEEVIGPGWSLQEDAYRWMTGSFSVLTLPLPPTKSSAADFILMLRVTPFTANGQIDGQRCTVVCGGETVAEVKLVLSSWIGFRISAEAVVSGKLAILFVHPDAGSPQKFGVAPDSRELAIAVHKAVLLPVTEADESMGWRGRTGQFVSSDWRTQALVPDWKRIASTFQSMGQDCEFGLVQRQCEAEPLGLLRWCNMGLPALIQCLLSEFSELTDEDKLTISPFPWNNYTGEYKSIFSAERRRGDHGSHLIYHTWIPVDPNLDVDVVRRKELTRIKMMVRLFKEDLEGGEKVFVLLRKDLLRNDAPLDEFEVLPVISLMRRYNPKAALLWITEAGPDERHLVGQCEMVGNNLLKGYIDRLGRHGDLWNTTFSPECWKDIMVSALQALGRPIPTHAHGLPPSNSGLR